MKKTSWILVLLSGVLSFFIHPIIIAGYQFPDMSLLVWIFLVPLILASQINAPLTVKKIFCIGLFFSAVGHYGLIYWLITAMRSFGGMNFFEAFGVLTAQVVLFGSIFAFFFTLAVWVRDKTKLPYFLIIPVFLTLRDFTLHFFPFGGYPWGIPPYSQGEWLSCFQWIDHTGPLGLSFLIYLVNALCADAITCRLNAKKTTPALVAITAAIPVLMALSFFCSSLSLKHYHANKKFIKNIRVALIQANIPQDTKWNPKLAGRILDKHVALTDRALDENAELVLWSETAYPYGLVENKMDSIKFLDRDSFKAPLLVGSIIKERKNNQTLIFNSAVHVGTDAAIKTHYKKMHLVPFGEYLPFAEYLDFMQTLTQGVGFFSPGNEYIMFDILSTRLAPLICIEDIFTTYGRRFKNMGADVLVNFTNDAWYGASGMQLQHLAYTQMRALENRLPLIRATNNGYTAVIDATGKVTQTFPQYTEGYLLHDLVIEKGDSFYSRHGDRWLAFIVLSAAALFLYGLWKHR
ncbi:MAG: apolipoprotein N-acyltransferase [Deltaproteobacteria bacterium]|nr:apolipoprotein N-acyltransferase [Deltaproteobacteria bacterium]